MSMRDAMDLVPDDMPDGAFWAMAHEFAGLDYGDGFDELIETSDVGIYHDPLPKGTPNGGGKPWVCGDCLKRFRSRAATANHRRDKGKHGK